jgi:hypothetical protein
MSNKKLWHFIRRKAEYDRQDYEFYMGDEPPGKRSYLQNLPDMKRWAVITENNQGEARLNQPSGRFSLIETKKGWLVVRDDVRFAMILDIPDGIPALRKKFQRGLDKLMEISQEFFRLTRIHEQQMTTFWEGWADSRVASDEYIVGFVDVEYLRHGPMSDRAAILKLYEEWMRSADDCARPWKCCGQERSHQTFFCSNCGKPQPRLPRPELNVAGRWISVEQMRAVWNDEIRRRKQESAVRTKR